MRVEDMPAGPALDALVAEKVMEFWWFSDSRGFRMLIEPITELENVCYTTGQGPFQRVPHYSTDIAAAWLVVEKMRDKGWYWAVYYFTTIEAAFTYAGLGSKAAQADIAPLAICRAALLAVGVTEVPDEDHD